MTQEEYLKRFIVLTEVMQLTTKKKNADYAHAADAFANFRAVEALGVASTAVGILTRMSDKFVRLANLATRAEGPAVADESVFDTLLDLANYSLILYIYLETKE